VSGSLSTIEKYIELGMEPAKMNLGLPFYGKWFKTAGTCTYVGCPTALLEDSNGMDTGNSGALEFSVGSEVFSKGIADENEGGQWYWDPVTSSFWTWDTVDFINRKLKNIVQAKKLGGASKLFRLFTR
jgi:chitinase